MLRVNKKGLIERGLLLACFFCIGLVGRAEAIDFALPSSIHEILSPAQIEKVRASNALKGVQQGRVQDTVENQIGSNASAIQKMIGMRLGRTMSSKLSAQVEKKTTLKSEKLNSELTVQTAPAPER